MYYKTCFPSDLTYIINNPSNHPDNSSVISWFSDVVRVIFHLICLSAKWAMIDIGNIIKLFPWLLPLKWWSLRDWDSCPCGALQACLHVRFHLSLPVTKPLLHSHHSLSFNHWRMKRAEEKRKEAHDVTWVCVSFGCLLGPRAESPSQTPSSVWNSCSPLLQECVSHKPRFPELTSQPVTATWGDRLLLLGP